MPHLISRSLKFGINESLVNLGAFNCINCNLCTVVCPSKLPLARQLRETKARLLEVGCDNSSCVLPRFDLRGVEEYKGVRSVR
jgi:Na+-translocating ferredoxin:NAD+ oxidoreductase RnfC subunit